MSSAAPLERNSNAKVGGIQDSDEAFGSGYGRAAGGYGGLVNGPFHSVQYQLLFWGRVGGLKIGIANGPAGLGPLLEHLRRTAANGSDSSRSLGPGVVLGPFGPGGGGAFAGSPSVGSLGSV